MMPTLDDPIASRIRFERISYKSEGRSRSTLTQRFQNGIPFLIAALTAVSVGRLLERQDIERASPSRTAVHL